MTQVRNYAAQAEAGLRKWAGQASKMDDMQADAVIALEFADRIKRAVHFSLPDDGELLDDGLRGLVGFDVRLPYPEITVEYFVHDDPLNINQDTPMHVPKRLVYAQEITFDEAAKSFTDSRFTPLKDFDCDYVILVYAVCCVAENWFPVWSACVVPSRWDQHINGSIKQIHPSGADRPAVTGIPFPLFPGLAKRALDNSDIESWRRDMGYDIGGEVQAVLELCEALSCSNVIEHVAQQEGKSVNARRIRKGKLPLYETKTLVIESPGDRSHSFPSVGSSSDRNSPRQHLRRGHLRRLADGRRIWVNSCVVGSSDVGVIDKRYATRAKGTPEA